MARIAIIFFSAGGLTAVLADAVAEGVSEHAEVALCQISGKDIVEGRYRGDAVLVAADLADALIFGSPTFMGGPAAEFKAFADASSGRWDSQRWAGKIGAGFTSGGYPNGDQGMTLSYFSVLAAQHGMLWCPPGLAGSIDAEKSNRLGSYLGATAHVANGSLATEDVSLARHLGRRVAKVATQFTS